MKAGKKRFKRLSRIESVRTTARQIALMESAAAEGTLTRFLDMSERARLMVGECSATSRPHDGEALRHLGQFVGGLTDIAISAQADAARARSIADARIQALAECERRRAAAESMVQQARRGLAKATQAPVLSPRKSASDKVGTVLV